MLIPSENGKRNSPFSHLINELWLLSKEIKDSTLGASARKGVSVFLQTTLFHRKMDLFALQESGSINPLDTNPKRYSNSRRQEKYVQIIRSYSTPHGLVHKKDKESFPPSTSLVAGYHGAKDSVISMEIFHL